MLGPDGKRIYIKDDEYPPTVFDPMSDGNFDVKINWSMCLGVPKEIPVEFMCLGVPKEMTVEFSFMKNKNENLY